MRSGSRRLLIGSAGLAVSIWGLWRDVGVIAQPFYAFAWWSSILVVDGFVERRRGGSLLSTRRRLLLPVALWSITFWFFFELLNLRFQNWYYVGVFAGDSFANLVAGAVFGVACFATVFVGLFEAYDALGAVGLFRSLRLRPRPIPAWLSYGLQALGGTMVLASVLFSHWLAPLVWGSVTFLLDPWSYRRGGRSLLRDVERGEVGHLLRLLTAGFACGLVWESFNYFAPQKWIYTVRGLEELKLFEMPLLGFLGFPALAADAFAFFAFVSYGLHGNATWESPEDVPEPLTPRGAVSTRSFAAFLPFHVLLWALVSWEMQFVNIGSVELTLAGLSTLPAGAPAMLEANGIARPRQLQRALEDPQGHGDVQRLLGLEDSELTAVEDELRLLTFKGIGYHHGALLRAAGIRRVEQLAVSDPQALYRELVSLRGDAPFPALRPEMVRVWTIAARAVATKR
jgi:hypothetical protein